MEEAGDKVHLTFLLITGEKHEYVCNGADTCATVCENIFRDWPKEWENLPAKANSPQKLKLLFRGKFLEAQSTLSGIVWVIKRTDFPRLAPPWCIC